MKQAPQLRKPRIALHSTQKPKQKDQSTLCRLLQGQKLNNNTPPLKPRNLFPQSRCRSVDQSLLRLIKREWDLSNNAVSSNNSGQADTALVFVVPTAERVDWTLVKQDGLADVRCGSANPVGGEAFRFNYCVGFPRDLLANLNLLVFWDVVNNADMGSRDGGRGPGDLKRGVH